MEVLDLLGTSNKDNHYTKAVSNMQEFYLNSNIEATENYTDWYNTIRHATENDIIRLYINSYGGDLFTAIQFMRVLQETQATVIASVEGACMSAATMIFLQADVFEISPHSMFMFHNYSGGTVGKGGEMYDNILHEREWSDKLLHDVYADFLDDSEIDSLLNNKDLWMSGDDVVTRLEKKAKKVARK